ncbi:PREDICTED: membrane-spanning 4-domains subfamily A member 13 [Miniopterus natalensis]|uniref:membrane-spanning 4-domains subfamily A member 13 n=1 Tax=Miniopterus natalensis TaxID=291302 RepID=UPI0007A72F87|nr:PREDICTED: membrane-spanning 4-domains subfamily A member 13 [Miniopterus natalensis]
MCTVTDRQNPCLCEAYTVQMHYSAVTSQEDAAKAIQILIGSFHMLMWYFLLDLYIGQVKGVFGIYEPVTYKAGCALWGVVFVISGAFLIKVAKNPNPRLVTYTLILNIICIITAFTAICMILHELSNFDSVSYRNYGQAKLGREASRILLASNNLELAIALTYTIFIFIDLVMHITDTGRQK